MSINKITGEVEFNFDGKKYSVRPELGLAAKIEGVSMFPNQEMTSIYDIYFMFSGKKPMITVMGKFLSSILDYIGEPMPTARVCEKVFKMQGDEKSWFVFFGEMYEVSLSLCDGGIELEEVKAEEEPSGVTAALVGK